jgi:hypothetical protein
MVVPALPATLLLLRCVLRRPSAGATAGYAASSGEWLRGCAGAATDFDCANKIV